MAKQKKCEEAMKDVAEATERLAKYGTSADKRTREERLADGEAASQRVHKWMKERKDGG